MKFITVNASLDDLNIVHINIEHIVTITDHWIQKENEDNFISHAKILLSNGTEIICDEDVDTLEKEYKELFKQY